MRLEADGRGGATPMSADLAACRIYGEADGENEVTRGGDGRFGNGKGEQTVLIAVGCAGNGTVTAEGDAVGEDFIRAEDGIEGDGRWGCVGTQMDVHAIPAEADVLAAVLDVVVNELLVGRDDLPAGVIECGRCPLGIVAGLKEPKGSKLNALADVCCVHAARVCDWTGNRHLCGHRCHAEERGQQKTA